MNQANFAKLPKWAQTEILGLQQARDSMATELQQWQGAADSPLSLRKPTSMDFSPLPDGTVRFKLDSWDTGHIDIRIDEGALDITSGKMLVIQPWATNNIRLTLTN